MISACNASADQQCSAPASCNTLCTSCGYKTAGTGTFDDGSAQRFYENFATCEWTIGPEVPNFKRVAVTFTLFATEAGYDYVRVYGCNVNSCVDKFLLASYSGAPTVPFTVLADYPYMYVLFTSDRATQSSGWEAKWAAVVGRSVKPPFVSACCWFV